MCTDKERGMRPFGVVRDVLPRIGHAQPLVGEVSFHREWDGFGQKSYKKAMNLQALAKQNHASPNL